MQTKPLRHVVVAGFIILCSVFCLPAFAQGTAFTYQGRLNNNGAPANGSYDFAFSLFANRTGGAALAGPVTNAAVTVTNGLFTTLVDFGGVFNGTSNWLQLAVSTNAVNAYSPLTPRQQITPTPYALYSAGAATAATAVTATGVPAAGIGPGTANINISGNAATATTAATAGLAATATTAASATSATTAASANTSVSAAFAGTATNLVGLLPDAQLSSNIARLNGMNTFIGTNLFSNPLIATNPANQIYGTFTGSGAGLANLSSVSLAPASITASMLAPDAVTMLGTPANGPTNAVNVSTNGGVGVGTGTTQPTAGLQIANVVTQTVLTAQFSVTDGQAGWTNLSSPVSCIINGNVLAVGSLYGLTLADLTIPSSPVILAQLVNGVGTFTNIIQLDGLAWAGSNLVAAAYESSAVTIIGCTNPSSP
ncbi:MAG TPA: hypothetical protein VG347_24105, partial [Verrucomicrobiae bacterium]|nr:hypothetical protein [Verrucomicrobiae bacterium]